MSGKNLVKKNILSIIAFLFLVLSCGACVRLPESTQTEATVQTSPTLQNPPLSQKSEINPLINFFPLANKSASEIEKLYGKPSIVDTKFVQSKDKGGEFRIYDKSSKRFLQVDYFNGKAIAFYLDIPESSQNKSAEETLKLCGFGLHLADAQTEAGGFWWDNPSGAKPFYIVRIRRFNDSGLYYNCEAQLKII